MLLGVFEGDLDQGFVVTIVCAAVLSRPWRMLTCRHNIQRLTATRIWVKLKLLAAASNCILNKKLGYS